MPRKKARTCCPRKLIVLAAVALAMTAPARASTKVDLNGYWRFRVDRDEQGEKQGWARSLPPDTDVVRVPHTWNIGRYDDYEGIAWYFRTVVLNPCSRGQRIELHFAATFYKSRVWMNGELLGEHEGGHTPYWFNACHAIRAGDNYISVQLDNRPTAQSIPGFALRLREGGRIWYDWWHYGGIVRDAWLTISQQGLIRRERITSVISGQKAQVTCTLFLENFSNHRDRFRLAAHFYSPEGILVGNAESALTTVDPGAFEVHLTTSILRIERWELDHPALYQVVVELRDAHDRPVDRREDSFGLRTLEIRDRHLLLNGERVRLTGLTRHEDSPWEGLAESVGTIEADYEAMGELHVRLTRPVHYPQHELIFDYADRHGILLIPEIPMWQFTEDQMKDPKVVALARQMLREMLEEDENHASIFAWSVCNESQATTQGGRVYIDQMRDWIHQLDPGRFVTYADSDIALGPDPRTEAANDVDFIMMNAYFGTWTGSEQSLVPRLEQIGRDYPTKMLIISEFGYPGVFSPDSAAADRMRVQTIESQLDQFQQFDFVAGAIFWCYQDYKSHQNLWPGHAEGYVDHGVVDEYRQRRPSFGAWEKRNRPVKFANEKWIYDTEGNRVGFEVKVSARQPDEIPSYPLRDGTVRWELRDREGNLLFHGDQPLLDLRQAAVINASWAKGPTAPLHLQVTFLDLRGSAEGTTVLDAYPLNVSGQRVEDMKQAPH